MNRKLFSKVKQLAAAGLTSPTVVLDQVPEIKQWRTAKKYLAQALEELKDQSGFDTEQEYVAMVEGLKLVKAKLSLRLSKVKHVNQSVGLFKQLAKVNDQLIALLNLTGEVKDQAVMFPPIVITKAENGEFS